MATNLSLDPDLLDLALEVSGERTKKAAVTRALEEFILRRKQKRLLDLMGKLEWDKSFDYKAERFSALPLLVPDRQNHIDAAELRNKCRRSGVQIGAIDALLAQLCIHHSLTLLTIDQDFVHVAAHCPLRLWKRRG